MCSGTILIYGIPRVIIGENKTYMERKLLRARGAAVEVLQYPLCIRLMEDFIRSQPDLWNEDIGV